MDQHALRKAISDRVWQTSHQQEESSDGLENPLPSSAQEWLRAAAEQFGVDGAEQRQFASTGLLRLEALHVMLICQSEEPVPLWLAVGWLATPEALHPDVWQEALLRANDVAMAQSGIGLSLEENGNALLTKRLPPDSYGDADELASVMNDFNSLSSSLIDLLLSLGQQQAEEPENTPPLPGWIAGWQQQMAERVDTLARQAIATEWHYPLMREAFSHLELSDSNYLLEGCFCTLRFPERLISVLADGDRRHLLLSTPLDLDPSPGPHQRQYLLANRELKVLTQCSLALCGEHICLVSRWDSQGLDGEEFASWLADFMTLSVAFDRREQTAA